MSRVVRWIECARIRLAAALSQLRALRASVAIVTPTAAGYAVRARNGELMAELSSAGPSGPLDFPAGSAPPQVQRATLRLEAGSVLQRRVVLPPAARAHWRSAVQLQFESWFPLAEPEACWQARLVGTEDTLCVAIVAARRTEVEAAVERIAAAGIRIARVEAMLPEGKEVELYRPRYSAIRTWRPMERALLVGALGLVFAAAALAIAHRGEVDQRLESQLSASRRAASGAERDLLKLTHEREAIDRIDRDLSASIASRVVADLSEHLPGHSWISELEVSGDAVRLVMSIPKGLDARALIKSFTWASDVSNPSLQPDPDDAERELATLSIAPASTSP